MPICLIAFYGSIILLLACGTGEDPTQLKPETGPPPTVEQLQQRVEEATLALNEGRWLDFYAFKSPQSVRARLPYGLPAAQLCTEEQFVFDTGQKIAEIRSLIGLEGDERITWHITDISVEDREGVVKLDVLHDGKLVTDELHDYWIHDPEDDTSKGARWIYTQGEWWVEPVNWEKGCHIGRPFG